ncbi:MAG TPA: YfbM family protein [Acetobacteraceae bacterium]|nr:YfbM family protein [Acetobacteraceae bacterium]
MGMVLYLRRVDDGEMRHLLAEPDGVERFLFGDPPPPPPRQGGILGFLKRLSPIKVESVEDYPLPTPRGGEDELDLEGVWEELHALLTGTAWEGEEPACYLLAGGEELGGDAEIGAGPPRLIRPAEVARFAEHLDALSTEEVAARYDPARMTALGVHPRHAALTPSRPDQPVRQHLLDAFEDLRGFVRETAGQGRGIVAFLA